MLCVFRVLLEYKSQNSAEVELFLNKGLDKVHARPMIQWLITVVPWSIVQYIRNYFYIVTTRLVSLVAILPNKKQFSFLLHFYPQSVYHIEGKWEGGCLYNKKLF